MSNRNILSRTRVYLAGPVEYDENASSWRDRLTEFLKPIDVTVYDPLVKPKWMPPLCHTGLADRKNMSGPDVEYSWDLDRLFCLSLVISADWVICRLDKSLKTFGTTEELGLAKQLGKPVILWFPEGWPSTWIESMFRESIICDSETMLRDTITAINNNELELNPLSWIGAAYTRDHFHASF